MELWLVFMITLAVGWTGVNGDAAIKIIYGEDATPGQFPYIAAFRSIFNKELVCSGMLVSSTWVLTDTFAIGSNPLWLEVVLGLHDFDNFENGGDPEVYRVEEIVKHPENNANLLALVRLSRPANLNNPFIQMVQLAPDDGYDYSSDDCFFAGWGNRRSGEKGGVLQFSSSSLLTDEDCGIRGWDPEKRLCVYNGQSGTCYLAKREEFFSSVPLLSSLTKTAESEDGTLRKDCVCTTDRVYDEGGPFVCSRDSEMYLVGSLAFEPPNCDWGFPSIYERLSYYNEWINSITA